jgi:hypothetical protein
VRRSLTVIVAVVLVIGLGVYLAGLGGVRSERVVTLADTRCQEASSIILLAQSVPTAQLIPCLTEGAQGWVITRSEFTSDGSTVHLTTGDLAGADWTITLTPTCAPDAAATERSYPDQGNRYVVVGMTTEDPDARTETDTEWYRFAGGCTMSSVAIPSRFDSDRIFAELDSGFVFAPRSAVAAYVSDESDGRVSLDPPADPS